MHLFELILTMLVAVLVSGHLARALPVALPLPLLQIALGALIAGGLKHGVTLEPRAFFLLFLPPLLFLDGWRIPKDALRNDAGVVLQLALGLVVFTVIGAGLLIHWLMPAMPLAVAFALAAILSPTDPVAVTAIAARAPIPHRLMRILEGEALLNDASGLVSFRFAVAAVVSGTFSLAAASLTFVYTALAGLAIGTAVTFGISAARVALSRRFGEEQGSPILTSLLMPFAAYLAAEALGASGILAAVAGGVAMSYAELRGGALASTRVDRTAVWNTLQLALNGIVFVLLGEQLPAAWTAAHAAATFVPGRLALDAIVITLGLALLRHAWVWASLGGAALRACLRGRKFTLPPHRQVVAMSLAGVRGAVTMAGVLTLPLTLADGSVFPMRDAAIFVAAAVILLSLIIASVALPRILRGLPPEDDSRALHAEESARRDAAEAAIAAVEQEQRVVSATCSDAAVYASAAAHVIGLYQHRLEAGRTTAIAAETLRAADTAERQFRLAALRAERDRVFDLARHDRISDATSRKLVREIDLVESRYR
jgi:monovalent cation/hydrogen antiporter